MAGVQRDTVKDATHILILVVMLAVLLFLLTWTNVTSCRVIPGWCDIYWSVVRGGQPRILIVYGNEGMGNPDLLKAALADPNYVHVQAQMQNIDLISYGNLKNYDLVIVEKAKKISTAKLKSFIDYVNQGGRLVWTGDAGTELAEGDVQLFADERTDGAKHELLNPWARKDGDKQISFDELLSVKFVTNFCSIKACSGIPWQGILVTDPERNHPLVYSLRQGLSLRGDFAIVNEKEDSVSTRVLSLDWQSHLIGTDKKDYGNTFPIIVTSGFGERVAYYAVPPEQFIDPALKEKYYSIIENMYYGMLK